MAVELPASADDTVAHASLVEAGALLHDRRPDIPAGFVGELYAHAAAGLYPDSLAELKQDYADSVTKSKAEQTRGTYSARVCDALSDVNMVTVYNAVLDLTEQSTAQ